MKMTAMPQMVALFNGVGGGAAALIALAEFHNLDARAGPDRQRRDGRDPALGADRIGFVRRKPGRVREAPGPRQRPADRLPGPEGRERCSCSRSPSALGATIVFGPQEPVAAARSCSRARSLFGVLFVLPIGGADMPVVISLLNAFTGLAAAATGFVLHSERADRERDARRRLGNAAHDPDGPSDEPLDRQRPVRRLRPGDAGGGRRARTRATGAPCARRPPRTSR